VGTGVNVKVTCAVCESVPAVPVTVTVKVVAVVEVHESCGVPWPPIIVVLRMHVDPEGVADSLRVTTSLNPL